MILHIYRAETNYKMEYDLYDIDTSKYEYTETIITDYRNLNEIIDAIENKEVNFEFEETDLIEIAPGIEELNNVQSVDDIDYKNGLNFLLIGGLGVEQIALDSKDLAMKRFKEQFV